MTDRKPLLFEVRPKADWLVNQASDTKEHQFRRFFGGLGPALGIEEPEFSETFRRAEDPSTEQSPSEQIFIQIDVLKVGLSQFVYMGALAQHDGFELIPLPDEQ